jgi:hypothetical protein
LRTNTTTCARLWAYVTGLVNPELLLQNEYLAAENRILKARLPSGWRLSDGERITLAEMGKRLASTNLSALKRGPHSKSRAAPTDCWSAAASRPDREGFLAIISFLCSPSDILIGFGHLLLLRHEQVWVVSAAGRSQIRPSAMGVSNLCASDAWSW